MRFILSIIISIVIIVAIALIDFKRFLLQRQKVARQFLVASTRFGPVEYLDLGSKDDPVILFSTGGGAGIDLIGMFDWLVNAGYRIIAVNRPGYYDLPVDVVDSIKGHAAIYHEVIAYLGIEEVNVFGVSMGGLSSLYYAQSYPTKLMVLWSPLTGEYHPKKEALESPFAKLFLSPNLQDSISWLMRRTFDLFPGLMLSSLLQAEAEISKREIKKVVGKILNDPLEKRRATQFVHSLAPMSQIYPGMMDELEKAGQAHPFDWSKIDMPVLAYASPVDKDVSQDHFDRLNTNLVNGEVRFVRAGGHFVWWGAEGKEVQAETLKFFNRVNK
ncbi:MAG: alpha/beta hydrolase [Bacteroidota bacterium]